MTKDQYLGFQRGPRPEQSDQRQPDQAASFSHKAEALRDSASVASRIRFPTGTACRKSNPNILARPGLEGEEYALPSEPCAIGAHPCPTIGACASHYSSSCKTAARDEDAARRIQQHGQGIPAGSNRSAVQYIPSQ